MSVVVLGDANVDLELRLPATGQTALYANPDAEVFGGGSAANTAAALARLDVSCRFAGTVGDDEYGRLAKQSLEQAGTDVSALTVVSGSPTVMVIVVVTTGGERLIYVWPPKGGAHAGLTVDHALAAAAGADWLHVSGVCLRVEPARQALLESMTWARSAGIPVSLDLNLRLENWGWDNGFRDTVLAAVAQADVVLGAAADEIVPLAQVTDTIEAAATLAGDSRIVIARMGADGSFGCTAAEGVIKSASFPVDAVDTVGAGDAFNAGFIAARTAGADIAAAMRWGNATAALSITRAGARSTPRRHEVETLLAERP